MAAKVFLPLALLALSGCAPRSFNELPDAERALAAGMFSRAGPGAALPAGWAPWRIDPRKPSTRYALVRNEGIVVVHAQAAASVSGLIHRLRIDPVAYPLLRWRWKVEQPVAGASARVAAREDAAVRVVVAFHGDHARLEPLEQQRLALAGALSGLAMPYAMLMYIWSEDEAAGSIVTNPRSSRVRMVVVEAGRTRLGRWVDYERDVVADFRRAFGEEPGPIVAVGLLTDADDTRSTASAYYGDISFNARGE